MKKALLVVDMLNDFINQDGALFCGPTAQQIVPFVKARIEEHRANGHPVIFLCDAHVKDDREFLRFPEHAVINTQGARIIDELNFTQGLDSIVTKTRYSGFYNTSLEFTMQVHFGLKSKNTVVEVAGVCTSICCMLTLADLVNRDYATVVHRNCIADFDQDAHKFALGYVERILGTEVI
jgi:nicotinamidase-related amidase